MKRAEKIALLTRLVQGDNSEQTINKLHKSQTGGGIIAIIRYGSNGPTPDDLVTIREGLTKVTMPYKDLHAYTRRRGSPVVFVFPDNGRDTTE